MSGSARMKFKDQMGAYVTRFGSITALKEGGSVMATNGICLCLSFLSGILLARYLGPEGRGIVAAIMVYPLMVNTLCQLGIRQATVVEVGRKRFGEEAIAGAVFALYLLTTTLGLVTCAIAFFVVDDAEFSLPMIAIAMASIPFSLISAYAGGYFLGKQQIGNFNLTRWLNALLQVGAVLIFVVWLGLGIPGALASMVIAPVCGACYLIIRVRRQVKLRLIWDFRIIGALTRLGSVYALALFLNSLNYRIDYIMLQTLADKAAIGNYAIAVGLAEQLWQIPTILGVVIFARSANSRNGAAFSRKVEKVFIGSLIIGVVIAAIFTFAMPTVLPLIYGAEFTPAVSLLQLLMPGIVLMTGYKILGFDMAGKGKPWPAVYSSLPCLVINIALNYILIPSYGADGAAIASTISYTFMSLFFIYLYRKSSRMREESAQVQA